MKPKAIGPERAYSAPSLTIVGSVSSLVLMVATLIREDEPYARSVLVQPEPPSAPLILH